MMDNFLLDVLAFTITGTLSLFLFIVVLYTLGQMTIQTGINDYNHSHKWYIVEGFKFLISLIVCGSILTALVLTVVWGVSRVFNLGIL